MRRTSLLLWLAALAVVVVQAMALVTRYFQPWLDGDYLLPERFAADVLAGVHPLSGWTLSSSPYLFPDFALSLAWRLLLGGGPLMPGYVVMSYTGLALLAGWSLRRATGPDHEPWLLGAVLVNVLLAWQGAADHARWLWWLGVATFHGGAVLLGLAQFALWSGPAETVPGRGRRTLATGLLFLGLASDTLLLTQFVVPLGAALFLTAPRPRWSSPRLRAFGTAVLIALALVALLRAGLALAGWWNFPRVVRYAPTPAAVVEAGGQMLSDFAGPIAAAVPGFLLLLVAGISGAAWLTWRLLSAVRTRQPGPGKFVIHYMTSLPPGADRARVQAGWFAGLCLASTLALPVLSVYWRNPQSGRYLLPCLVIPLWWLLTLLPVARWRRPLVAVLVAGALAGLAAWRAPQVDFKAWTWPYPARVADLELRLQAGGHTRGLADFWHTNYLNAVSRTGLRLNQMRPDGRVQFWGNNAFHHFETDGPDAPLRAPRYTFILVNGLDAAALRAKFGDPASTLATDGGHEVWLYDDAGARRLSALVDQEVRAFLGDRPGTERIEK